MRQSLATKNQDPEALLDGLSVAGHSEQVSRDKFLKATSVPIH